MRSRRTIWLLAAALACGPTSAALAWRDLNHNGQLDPYEDSRLPAEQRVDDLLARMTLEEKVGTMVHGTFPVSGSAVGTSSTGYDQAAVAKLVNDAKITSFITRLSVSPTAFAEEDNAVQSIAEQSRLGIPLTISTDPRNHFQAVVGASSAANGFSQWPETLGFAALGDPALVRRFGQIAAGEYRAVGIHMALSPQADIATEPRWPRQDGTFGSDPKTVSELAGAYVEGFQGSPDGLQQNGVAAVVKHWVGYGAEIKGFDAHNYYGRFVRLSDATFPLHVSAFEGALNARAAGVMPTYAIVTGVTLDGEKLEPVGSGYSRQLLQDLLRRDHGYRGLILSDWAITNDCDAACVAPTAAQPETPSDIGMDWGVETLSQEDRFAKAVMAGIDQFGGVNDPAPLLAAVRAGKVPMERVDDAVRRALMIKFQLGLFDNPYVDPAKAQQIVGNPAAQAEADAAQRAAQVLLKNRDATLPLASGKRVWLYGIDAAVARAAGFVVVDTLAEAEAAIVRVATPFEKLHPYYFFGSMQHEGRLDFRDGDPGFEAIESAAAAVSTIVAVDMDRPAVLTRVEHRASAILALFGASDAALLDVVAGHASPRGRLPFELPRSMGAVRRQNPAVPADSAAPLYARGAGLTFGPEISAGSEQSPATQ